MKMTHTPTVKLVSIALALVALATTASVHAQSYRYFPDGTSEAPQYTQPTCVQPQPYYDNSGNIIYPDGYYVQPAPAYMLPEPVYVQPEPVYYDPPAPIFDSQEWKKWLRKSEQRDKWKLWA